MSSLSSRSSPLRIGLIGAGQIVQTLHAPVLRNLGHELVWAVDPVDSNVTSLRESSSGIRSFSSASDALETNWAEAVLIASPTTFHAAHARQALEAGHAVFCEKPFACRVREAQALQVLAAERKLAVLVGYYRRHFASLKSLAAIVRSGAFGRALGITVRAGHVLKAGPASFLDANLSGGGVTMDFGVHIFDLLTDWADGVKLEYYADDAEPGGVEANAHIRLKLRIGENYLPTAVNLSRTCDLGYSLRLECAHATVSCNLNQGHEISIEAAFAAPRRWTVPVSEPFDTLHYFTEEWREFEARLRGGAERTHRLSGAITATAIAEQCYESRQPLALPWGD